MITMITIIGFAFLVDKVNGSLLDAGSPEWLTSVIYVFASFFSIVLLIKLPDWLIYLLGDEPE